MRVLVRTIDSGGHPCRIAMVKRVFSDYNIKAGTASDIPDLKVVFLSLHDHHRQVSTVVLTEPDELAWSERVRTYEQSFRDGRALLHLARSGDRCVGYAFTTLHDGTDDTFPLGAGFAELYTLAVLPEFRGSGIGTALLDAVDATLSAAKISNVTVAMMANNEAAVRLYRRRGFIPGELILYRIGDKAQ